MTRPDDGVDCDGWWQQHGFGRQPMLDLRLRFDAGRITGSGYDIIGLFTLRGTITQEGAVLLHKRYLGQHAVEYVGHYDGEGLLWGDWRLGPIKDRWLIKITGKANATQSEAAITEIR